ncbi:hypothetical protein LC613_09390 [Nostoc sphaeroides CHAB 2801]|uniref:hypothetical protein n=1 Tax=Nostoc sphaeroides TaxID=446679 RepID=UPI001E310D20|nr:hypothetical protein [Nostoc sphaeroides]MCC5628314.1 hypothetical protein [Nostoc sphaeroides CHAB 2801]
MNALISLLYIAMLFNRLSGSEIDLKQILDQIRMLADQIHQLLEVSEILKIIVSEVRKTLESDIAPLSIAFCPMEMES